MTMSNVVVEPFDGHRLTAIVQSWKSFTASKLDGSQLCPRAGATRHDSDPIGETTLSQQRLCSSQNPGPETIRQPSPVDSSWYTAGKGMAAQKLKSTAAQKELSARLIRSP